jgi:hypothetical protein
MQLLNGKPVFSASDLVGFLAREHRPRSSWPVLRSSSIALSGSENQGKVRRDP